MKIANYIELCKPRVVMLMILTSFVGMCLASSHFIPVIPLVFGNVGIALVAGSAAAFNHLADQHIDKLMGRTQNRPLVKGKISSIECFLFSVILCVVGLTILLFLINCLTAILTFLSLIGYAIFYTLYLKYATPQNIVIGGLAGAAPPLLGWTAVTNSFNAEALLLVLIIFLWTPPHFWALAIYRLDDYAKANVPMLPHTHGVNFTKLNIVLYSILLICASLLPYFIQMSGLIYFLGVILVNIGFALQVLKLYFSSDKKYALSVFQFSIYYLGLLFLLLLVDHYFKF